MSAVDDYWGKDLPVNKGMWNFDEIRFDSYRDQTVAFESFKAGNLDYWQESSAKNWATAYDFPALHDGDVKRQEVGDRSHPADAGLRAEPAPSAIPGPARAPGAQSRFQLRAGQQEPVLRAV